MKQQAEASSRPKTRILNVPVHIELFKAMAHAIVDEDVTQKEWLHRILCQQLGREDLLSESPTTQ